MRWVWNTIRKCLLSFVGAACYVMVFACVCAYFEWNPPAWAWFIVGWMGYDDLFNAMTYKPEEIG